MDMQNIDLALKVGFMLYPVHDLERAIESWRLRSFVELWRTSEVSSILGHERHSKAQIMVEDHPDEHRAGAGPVFVVNDLKIAESAVGTDVDWIDASCSTLMGKYSVGLNGEGYPLRLLQLSSIRSLGERAVIFE